MTEIQKNTARKSFRILAGAISLLAICSGAFWIVMSIQYGEITNSIVSVVAASVFALEFGSIALKGHGLFLCNPKREK